jgi:DnaJ-domain-containing protein 1
VLRRTLRRVGGQVVLLAVVLLDLGGLGYTLVEPVWLAPWMTINLMALVFGLLSWTEKRRIQRESAIAMQRQAEKLCAAERQSLEDREREAQKRQQAEQAERLRQTEQQLREAEEVKERRSARRRNDKSPNRPNVNVVRSHRLVGNLRSRGAGGHLPGLLLSATYQSQPIPDQHAHLIAMMRGHYAYYGITGNFRRLRWYADQVERIWQKWLSRRDRGSRLLWSRLTALLKRHPLPAARIVHRYTFASRTSSSNHSSSTWCRKMFEQQLRAAEERLRQEEESDEQRHQQAEQADRLCQTEQQLRAAEERLRQEEEEHEAQRHRQAEQAYRLRQMEQQLRAAEERLRQEEEEHEAQRHRQAEQEERLRQTEQQLREAEARLRQEDEKSETLRRQQAEQVERLRQAEQRREAERRRHQEGREARKNRQGERSTQFQTDWWSILGVAPSASKDEIMRNFRRRIKQCHPDRVVGLAPEFLELAEEHTKALNEAYENAMRCRRGPTLC